MQVRQSFQPSVAFNDPRSSFIEGLRGRADLMSPGPERDKLLKKIEKAKSAADVEEWASSAQF